MPASSARVDAYTQVDVETASQGKLIVMLINGAIKRAEEAKRQIERGSTESVHNNLVRAQDIIGELRGSLNMRAGQIAVNLDRIYEYLQHLLITANIRKNPHPIDECVELMTQVRDMWQEVFDIVMSEDQERRSAQFNPHGSALLNLQG